MKQSTQKYLEDNNFEIWNFTKEDFEKRKSENNSKKDRLLFYLIVPSSNFKDDYSYIAILHKQLDIFFCYRNFVFEQQFPHIKRSIIKDFADNFQEESLEKEGRSQEEKLLTNSDMGSLRLSVDEVSLWLENGYGDGEVEITVQKFGYEHRRRDIDKLRPLLRKDDDCIMCIYKNDCGSTEVHSYYKCKAFEIYLLEPKKFYILIEK